MNAVSLLAVNPSRHPRTPAGGGPLHVARKAWPHQPLGQPPGTVVLGILAAILLFTVAGSAAATPLGDLAAGMQPGEWRQLTTNNISAVSQAWTAIGADPGYDDNLA